MTAPEPQVTSRTADASDQSVVDRLRTLADEELRDQRGGALLLDLDRPLVGIGGLDAGPRCDAVGSIDGVVVGYAVARVVEVDRIRVTQIDDLYVHPEARGVGVGASMLELVRSWAVEQGCTQIESQVLPGNREAKNFFERVGMVTRRMQVSTSL